MAAETSVDFTLAWLAACAVLCAVAFVAPAPRGRFAAISGRRFALAVFGVAFVLRAVPLVAMKLPGDALVQFDMDSYRIVAKLVRGHDDVYSQPDRYPYLPFQMYLFAGADWLSGWSDAPFLLLARFPQVLADAGIAGLLAAWPRTPASGADPRRLGVVYALNPTTILIATIHGQFDSVPLFFLVAAVFIAGRGEPSDRRAALTGLVLGMAILSKTWPVVALPLIAWHAGGWRERIICAVATGVLPLAGLLVYCAVFTVGPDSPLDAVTGYSGVIGTWGYQLVLQHLGNWGLPGAHRLVRESFHVDQQLLAVLVALAAVASLRRSLEVGTAVVIFVFYAAAPGWGYHWLAWALPFALLALPLPASGAYAAVASATLAAVFYGYGGVDYGLFELFDSGSAVIRYRWAVGVPMWGLSVLLAVGLLAWPWLQRQFRASPAPRAGDIEEARPAG
ncbi:MAG: hypothetical protein ACM3S1_12760 [Hyphomicrobiales bacterium]